MRLVATLGLAGAIAGFLIVFVFEWAHPRIVEYQEQVLNAAIMEVLGAPEKVEPVEIAGERIFAGLDRNGRVTGYAIVAAEPGFADVITLIFGYDPQTKRVLGMKVLENKETPGLGDKIVKDTAFVGDFRGAATPLLGVKAATAKGGESEIDLITGATISSRTVVAIINRKIEKVAPLLPAGAQP